MKDCTMLYDITNNILYTVFEEYKQKETCTDITAVINKILKSKKHKWFTMEINFYEEDNV